MDCEQSEKRMTIGSKVAPVQITHGLNSSIQKNRVQIPAEHLLSMGVNIFPEVFNNGAFAVPWAAQVFSGSSKKPSLGGAAVKKLSGNGMHMSNVLPLILFVLSRAEFTPVLSSP